MKQDILTPPKSSFDKVEHVFRTVENVLLVICACVLMDLMLLSAADVIGRFFFDKPITGTYEISTIMMGAVVLLGWAYTQRSGGHVTVDMFYDKFPQKMKWITTLIVLVLSLALFITITWKSWIVAMNYTADGRTFKVLDAPSGPTYFLVPVGGFFICLEMILSLIQHFRKGLKG
jgi:TRAP-type C4-dicarboxylate transport system permease small subunit